MRGHISKHGSSYRYVVDVGVDGKRRQETKSGFPTKKAAERALAEVLSALGRGVHVAASERTVATFLCDEWLPSMQARLRPTTWAGYRIFTDSYVVPHIGRTRLQDVSPSTLNALYGKLSREGGRGGKPLAPKTVRNVHSMLHKALGDAVRWGTVSRNVADLADPPKVPRQQMSVWSVEQLRAFLNANREDRLHGLYVLAVNTGMRRGELLGLRWSDVDLDAVRLSISQTLTLVGYSPTFGEPKTSASRRAIALDPTTVAALRAHKARQSAEQLAAGVAWNRTGLVFTVEDGSLVHPDSLGGLFEKATARAELPAIRFHDLRHSYATAALTADVSVKVVSQRLGHASSRVTLDVYSHVLPSHDEEAAARVAALIQGA